MRLRSLFLLLFTALLLSVRSQDIDIFAKHKNDNFKLPAINGKMSFAEFQLLDRNLRMQDMLYAMIVPGYAHFRAKDKATGYTLAGLRIAGFGAWYYVHEKTGAGLSDMLKSLGLPDSGKKKLFAREKNLLLYSSLVIVGTYVYDWIHGKYRLEKKQNMIRYKYGLKLRFTNITQINTQNTFRGVSLQYRF